jgi:sn-glycerol 3-phosphate transport system ATP-binding protein
LPARAPREGALTLGLRPEHALWQDGDGSWPLQVELVEMLGAERLVHGRLGRAPFTLRIDGTLTPPRPGQALGLRADAQRLHWFDSTTGQRVG